MPEWRTDLRRYLVDHAGESLTVRDLFDQFGAEMPLHDSTRIWTRRGRALGTTPHEHMRFSAFSQALRRLNVRFDPAVHRSSPLTAETLVTALAKPCKPPAVKINGERPGAVTLTRSEIRPDPRPAQPVIAPAPAPEPFWACARVQPLREAFAAEHLESRGFTVFLPKVELRHTCLHFSAAIASS
jgi:hypothetical protein